MKLTKKQKKDIKENLIAYVFAVLLNLLCVFVLKYGFDYTIMGKEIRFLFCLSFIPIINFVMLIFYFTFIILSLVILLAGIIGGLFV